MAGFVLIHGAWLGGFAFAPVARLLEAAGHRVDAPDLPGMGGGEAVTLADWAAFAVARCRAMAARTSGPVILAGHSRGGLVLSAAAEQAPDAMAGLAYICAMMLPGGSVPRLVWRAHLRANPVLAAIIRPAPVGAGSLLDAARVPALFAQCAPRDAARAMAARACVEPEGPLRDALALTDGRYGRAPRAYIACTHDRVIPLAAQRAMIAAQPGTDVIEIAADHSPFLSAPAALAQALIAIAGQAGY